MPSRILPVFAVLAALAACSVAFAQTPAPPPLTGAGARLHYLISQNLGAIPLAEDVAVGAINTSWNSPEEYGPHWSGFAKRTGMSAANSGVKSTMEVGLGSLWGEDPRYVPAERRSRKARLAHVIVSAFTARNASGETVPAWARFMAMPGSSFLANTWLPDSQATAGEALLRTGLGFASRMGGNFWKEFIARR